MYYGTSIPTEPAKEGPNTPTHIRRQIYHNMTVAATACIGVITTYRGGTGASGGPSRRLAAAPTDLVEVEETVDALDPATQLLKLKREIADQKQVGDTSSAPAHARPDDCCARGVGGNAVCVLAIL